MVEIALETALKGYRVFPVKPLDKDPPLIKNMLLEATTDPNQIKKWWKWWSDANVGLVPGPTYFVFDFDKRAGVQTSIKKLKDLGLPTETYTVRTPSGGRHLYYKHPGGGVIKAKDKEWASRFAGVDIRADNAYVLAPGSKVVDVLKFGPSARSYEVISDVPLATLPPAIVKILPYHTKKFTTDAQTPTDAAATNPKPFELPKTIKVGERDATMFGYICSLVAKGEFKGSITKKAKEAFKRCEQPPDEPFPWETVEAMIERALKEYGAPAPQISTTITLEKALERYILIADGNLVADLESHPRHPILKLEHWRNDKKNIWVKNGKREVQLPTVWLSHPDRKTAYTLKYHPEKHRVFKCSGHLYYNSYIPADIKPKEADNYKVAIEHLSYIFEGDQTNMKRFISWMAFTVRRPATRIPWAPIIISNPGVGKGWLYHLLRKLLGKENCQWIEPSALSEQKSNFNEWWGGTLLWIDEVDPKFNFVEKLKPIITETAGPINIKFGKKEQRDIFCNVIATSNHANALKIDETDRRWWVVRTKVQPQSPQYYTKLFEWLRTDGPACFLNFLNNYDISNWQYAAPPPVTADRSRMIEENRSDIEVCIRDTYELKNGPFKFDIVSTDLVAVFVRGQLDTDKLGWADKKQIGYILKRICPETLPQDKYTVSIGGNRRQVRLILIRNASMWCSAPAEKVVAHYLAACETTL